MDFRGLSSILYMEYDMLSRGADPEVEFTKKKNP